MIVKWYCLQKSLFIFYYFTFPIYQLLYLYPNFLTKSSFSFLTANNTCGHLDVFVFSVILCDFIQLNNFSFMQDNTFRHSNCVEKDWKLQNSQVFEQKDNSSQRTVYFKLICPFYFPRTPAAFRRQEPGTNDWWRRWRVILPHNGAPAASSSYRQHFASSDSQHFDSSASRPRG